MLSERQRSGRGQYDNVGKLIQETVWMNDLPVATSFARNGPKGSSATLPLGTTGTGAATANNVGNNTAANRVNTDVFYVHPDHLGTPRVVSKPADNKKVWEWNSSPFGETAPNENPQGLTGAALTAGQFRYNLRFPGQFFDAESGKHYNYFRDYDASIGRYLESDPIGLDGGINTFGYVRQSPILMMDERGLMPAVSDPACFAAGNCKCRTAECAAGLPPTPPPKKCSATCLAECLAFKLGGGALGNALWRKGVPSGQPFSGWSFFHDACLMVATSNLGWGVSAGLAALYCENRCCSSATGGDPPKHFKPW